MLGLRIGELERMKVTCLKCNHSMDGLQFLHHSCYVEKMKERQRAVVERKKEKDNEHNASPK